MKERWHQLTGHYIDDELLHLGVVDGRNTTYACGAKSLGLCSSWMTDKDGNLTAESFATFRTEPTQHRAWTKDRAEFERAENKCPKCGEFIGASERAQT